MSGPAEWFPKLAPHNHKVTSPVDQRYNCIAWAYGKDDLWFWPDADSYWPPEISRVEEIQAFVALYSRLGYEVCADGELTSGFEKVTIYCDEAGKPTHAALQLPNGMWASKCGCWHDIEHELDALNGSLYGKPTVFMSRPR